MNRCKDCAHFDHPDKIECEYEKWPYLINGEERGWCHKIYKKESTVAYGWFVTPNTETDCPDFKYNPRNWDGISESSKIHLASCLKGDCERNRQRSQNFV